MTPAEKKALYVNAKKLGMRAAVLLTPSWSDADFVAFDAMARANRADPPDLLNVIASESHTLEPSARNPVDPGSWPIAVGLNQLTRTAAAASGLIPQETWAGSKSNLGAWKVFADGVVKMTVGQQIPVVGAYYAASPWTKAGRAWPNAAKIYAYNAAGGTAMKDLTDDTVIYAEGTPEALANRGLDVDGKGGITGRDLRLAVEYHRRTPLLQAAFLRLMAPSLRAGFVAGWTAGKAHATYAPTVAPVGVDADMYAIGYAEGYPAGALAPPGAVASLPAHLAS